MKRCPICQKEFPDTMRFCQADGTPLVDVASEVSAEDPLRTTVVRQEDIASSIPASDPFQTMVAGSELMNDDSGDLLQLPEEVDPMQTMVASPVFMEEKPVLEEVVAETPRFEEIRNEILAETPVSASDEFNRPADSLPQNPDSSYDPTVLQPELPQFSEPSLEPPTFGAVSSDADAAEDLPQTMIQNSWDAGPKFDDSPFSKPVDAPSSSPFDPPKSPFEAPKSPFDPPFDEPQPAAFNPPPVSFGAPSPYEEPANPSGGAKFDQMSQGVGGQAMQQSEWAPPTAPDQGWQSQGLGADTPFQPPVAGVGSGANQTLAIVSLILGIVNLATCVIPSGPIALVLGIMARKKAKQQPQEYGGEGLAMAGIITGIIGTIFLLLVAAYFLLVFLAVFGSRF